MKKTSQIFIFLCFLFASACSQSPATTPALTREEEEYRIYSTIIREKFLKPSITTIVIRSQAQATPGEINQRLEYLGKELKGLTKELRDDFLNQNKQAAPLEDRFHLDVKIVLLGEDEFKQIFSEKDGWDSFYKTYPNSQGILTFSKVGFNRQRDQALVSYGNQSYWLAGAGYFILLEKENGAWSIKTEIMDWIS